MHSTIVLVIKPENDHLWERFTVRVKAVEVRSKAVERLAENVWQVNARMDLSALSKILGAAEAIGLTYRMLVFDDEPRWLVGNPTHSASISFSSPL